MTVAALKQALFAALLEEAQKPPIRQQQAERIADLERQLAMAQGDCRKAVAIAVNTVEREFTHKAQLKELEHQCQIKLLQQELAFLRFPSSKPNPTSLPSC